MGGVGGVGGVVLESSAGATTTHYASFLTLGGVGGGPGRRAGGRGRWGGTRLVWEQRGWVREWCRSGRGGQLLFWGEGEVVPGRKGVKWRGLTRCGGHQDTLDSGLP